MRIETRTHSGPNLFNRIPEPNGSTRGPHTPATSCAWSLDKPQVAVSWKTRREGDRHSRAAWDAALRFWPGWGDALPFFAGRRREPSSETGAPGSAAHSGQNHSPSGTASSGGSRHLRWYG